MTTRTTQRTQADTRTYTLSNVEAVTHAICEDLEEIVRPQPGVLARSVGATVPEDPDAAKRIDQRVASLLQNDLFRLLSKGYVDRLAFVFHEKQIDPTQQGYVMNYEARYEVLPGQRQGQGSGRLPHTPLQYAASASGDFQIIVRWSSVFRGLSEGERQVVMQGESGWNFQWIAPTVPLVGDVLTPGQLTAQYESGGYGVARIERARIR